MAAVLVGIVVLETGTRVVEVEDGDLLEVTA